MFVIFCGCCTALLISTQFMMISAFTVPKIQNQSSFLKNGNKCFHRRTSKTRLNSISEWRDMMFDEIPISDLTDTPLRKICVLPFPHEKVNLQGETKEIRLFEESQINLFHDCIENYFGVLAMGLLAESGVIQSVPICKIESYSQVEGFGIFATLRVVGRASLVTLTQQEPYMKALCSEKIDKISYNLDLCNLLASNIEKMMFTIASMEFKLQEADIKIEDCSNLATSTMEKEKLSSSKEADLRRRVFVAQLERQFNDYNTYDLDDDCGDYDGDNDDDEYNFDRFDRFRLAYEAVKASDYQGYVKPLSARRCGRSLQILTAISWAAFCTDEDSQEISNYRIRALDGNNLFERLKLGSHFLKKKIGDMEQLMKKNGIKFESRDENSFPPAFGSEEDL